MAVKSGILITGKSSDNKWNKAWVYDGKKVKSISNLAFQHKHHCGAFCKDKAYIISGKFTSEVEVWHGDKWKTIEPLPLTLTYASATGFNDNIIVCGGCSTEKYMNKVYMYSQMRWEALEFKLPAKLASHAVSYCLLYTSDAADE